MRPKAESLRKSGALRASACKNFTEVIPTYGKKVYLGGMNDGQAHAPVAGERYVPVFAADADHRMQRVPCHTS